MLPIVLDHTRERRDPRIQLQRRAWQGTIQPSYEGEGIGWACDIAQWTIWETSVNHQRGRVSLS